MKQAVTGWYFTNKQIFSLLTQKFYFVRKIAVWDTVQQIRKPQAVGSNPTAGSTYIQYYPAGLTHYVGSAVSYVQNTQAGTPREIWWELLAKMWNVTETAEIASINPQILGGLFLSWGTPSDTRHNVSCTSFSVDSYSSSFQYGGSTIPSGSYMPTFTLEASKSSGS